VPNITVSLHFFGGITHFVKNHFVKNYKDD